MNHAETINSTSGFFLAMNDWGTTPIMFFSVCVIMLVIGVWLYFYAKTFTKILKALDNINHTLELNNKTTEAVLGDLKYKTERSMEMHERTHRKLDMLILKEKGIVA